MQHIILEVYDHFCISIDMVFVFVIRFWRFPILALLSPSKTILFCSCAFFTLSGYTGSCAFPELRAFFLKLNCNIYASLEAMCHVLYFVFLFRIVLICRFYTRLTPLICLVPFHFMCLCFNLYILGCFYATVVYYLFGPYYRFGCFSLSLSSLVWSAEYPFII